MRENAKMQKEKKQTGKHFMYIKIKSQKKIKNLKKTTQTKIKSFLKMLNNINGLLT